MTSDPNTRESPKPEKRIHWWAIFALSLIAILFAGIELTQRIGAYYDRVDHPLYAFQQIVSTDFSFDERRVTVEEIVSDRGEPAIRVTYGDQELLLPVVFPPKHELPTLYDRQREWMTLVFFADRSDMTLQEFHRRIAADEIPLRLALVTRTPFGFKGDEGRFEGIEREQNWAVGEVRRDKFRYDFYEFKRDGTLAHETKRFPESGKSFLRRRVNADLRGEPEPQRDPNELQEYTWQYNAAIQITNRPPPITQERQALLDAGWSLPVAAAGFLMAVVSFFFAIAPERTREEPEPAEGA